MLNPRSLRPRRALLSLVTVCSLAAGTVGCSDRADLAPDDRQPPSVSTPMPTIVDPRYYEDLSYAPHSHSDVMWSVGTYRELVRQSDVVFAGTAVEELGVRWSGGNPTPLLVVPFFAQRPFVRVARYRFDVSRVLKNEILAVLPDEVDRRFPLHAGGRAELQMYARAAGANSLSPLAPSLGEEYLVFARAADPPSDLPDYLFLLSGTGKALFRSDDPASPVTWPGGFPATWPKEKTFAEFERRVEAEIVSQAEAAALARTPSPMPERDVRATQEQRELSRFRRAMLVGEKDAEVGGVRFRASAERWDGVFAAPSMDQPWRAADGRDVVALTVVSEQTTNDERYVASVALEDERGTRYERVGGFIVGGEAEEDALKRGHLFEVRPDAESLRLIISQPLENGPDGRPKDRAEGSIRLQEVAAVDEATQGAP